MPQEEGKERKIAFSVLLKNTPDRDAMQSLKHHVNTEVRQRGFQGYGWNVNVRRLPGNLVNTLLQGDENAYKTVLLEFNLRYGNKLSEEKIEELLQETIEQTLARKRRNTNTDTDTDQIQIQIPPEIQIFNSSLLRLYKQKIGRKANFTVNVEDLPELPIECVGDGPDTPSAMVEKMQEAVEEAPLTKKERQVIETLLANPEWTLKTLAQHIEGQLTPARIGQVRKEALKKIITKAAELGYEELVQLYRAKHKQNSCPDKS